MRTTLLALVFLCVAIPAKAQNKPTADKKFLVVNAALIGATTYDIESTYFALSKCEGKCHEGNPTFMRSFVKAGRPGLYAVQGAIDAGVIYASYKLKKGDEKLWWFLPIALTVPHLFAGTHNIRIAVRF